MEANKKQAAISTGRTLLLFVIFGIATIALMAEPYDNSNWWMEQFFASKVIAAAGFMVFWRLYARWSKTDKWIKAYNESCDKALEAENPLYIGKEEDQ